MEFKKHPMFIVCTGLIIAIGRYLMHNIDNKDTYDFVNLIFMSIVNYVAIGMIILFIHSDAQMSFEKRIKESGINTSEKKKRINIIKIFSEIIIVLYLFFGILYVLKFKTTDLNDAISIVALSMSICTNDLSDSLAEKYWEIFLAKKKK